MLLLMFLNAVCALRPSTWLTQHAVACVYNLLMYVRSTPYACRKIYTKRDRNAMLPCRGREKRNTKNDIKDGLLRRWQQRKHLYVFKNFGQNALFSLSGFGRTWFHPIETSTWVAFIFFQTREGSASCRVNIRFLVDGTRQFFFQPQ